MSLHQQVQHILASTSPSGRSVVWDLRKNEPIITVADTSTMVNCGYLASYMDTVMYDVFWIVKSLIKDCPPVYFNLKQFYH